MKRSFSAALALVLAAPLALVAAPSARAQATIWKSDPVHSEVDFSIKHLTLTNVHGRFGAVNATVVYDPSNLAKSSVTATIDVAGVDTGEAARDNHLKTDAFFDVSKYATATFQSTNVAKAADGLTITGNLTIRGVTKPVVLHVVGPTAPVTGMDKKQHVGFSATTTIRRQDWGIGTSFPSSILGDDVSLEIDLDVAQQ